MSISNLFLLILSSYPCEKSNAAKFYVIRFYIILVYSFAFSFIPALTYQNMSAAYSRMSEDRHILYIDAYVSIAHSFRNLLQSDYIMS